MLNNKTLLSEILPADNTTAMINTCVYVDSSGKLGDIVPKPEEGKIDNLGGFDNFD